MPLFCKNKHKRKAYAEKIGLNEKANPANFLEVVWHSDSEDEDFTQLSDEDIQFGHNEKEGVPCTTGSDDKGDMEEEISCRAWSPTDADPTVVHKWVKVEDVYKKVSEKLNGISDYKLQHSVIGFANKTPFECFEKFFPDSIYHHVAMETNRYEEERIKNMVPLSPKSRFHKWEEVSAKEIKAFIAIEIAMGFLHKPSLEDYFQENFWLTQTPGFKKIFSRNRYQLIRSCLHFANNDDKRKNDRLYKINPILDMTKNLYSTVYIPNRELRIDERMVKFQRRLFFKQYRSFKEPSKLDINIWSLCDSHTGYVLKYMIYTREMNFPNKDSSMLSSTIVNNLLKEFGNKGNIVYMNKFFSSVDLYDSLKFKDIGACGTVKSTVKGLPEGLDKIELRQEDSPVIYRDEELSIMVGAWRDSEDTNAIYMLSTIGATGVSKVKSRKMEKKVEKLNVQVLYNKYMKSINCFDKLCYTYPFSKKNMRWYLCIWYFIIEVALVNARICYNIQNNAKLTTKQFRKEIIKGMLEGYNRKMNIRIKDNSMLIPTSLRLQERHFPSQFVDKAHKPNCTVCSIIPAQCKKKGKGDCKRKQTTYYCADCTDEPPLCVIPCFRIYHTVSNFKRKCSCD